MPRVTEVKKRWKRLPLGQKANERYKKRKGSREAQKNKGIVGEEQHARGEFDAISYG